MKRCRCSSPKTNSTTRILSTRLLWLRRWGSSTRSMSKSPIKFWSIIVTSPPKSLCSPNNKSSKLSMSTWKKLGLKTMFKSYSPQNAYPEPLYSIIKTGSRLSSGCLSPTLKPVSRALSTIKLALTLFATSIIKKILKENPPKKVKSLSKVSLPSINYFLKKNQFSLKLPSGTTLLFTLLNPVLCKSTNSFPSTSKTKLIVGERLSEQNGGC